DVDFLDPPMPFSLGADTILCPGESVLLVAPGGGFMNQWQDGSSAPTYLADQPGTYSLQIQNQCGIAYDEMSLDFDQQIPVVQFDPVLFICPDQVIELDATQSFPVIYLWSTGSNEPSIQVKSPGQYAVSVQTPCVTIPAQTEVAISDTCNVAIAFYIPNVFSPDGDGINDVFSIFPSAGTDVTHLACSVFDRWGNLVFSSSSYPFEWPGDFNGQKLDPGVYAYRVIITYMDHSTERQVTRSGDITLVR
ncbi:MAG TPA: gliding motility-associated C-terminal domain-containing protein, partial [Saprospiraceae bacterium]|nr:gliding motility-associated C-terminal domain-containing protein [Saprospiraceae bacterium]